MSFGHNDITHTQVVADTSIVIYTNLSSLAPVGYQCGGLGMYSGKVYVSTLQARAANNARADAESAKLVCLATPAQE